MSIGLFLKIILDSSHYTYKCDRRVVNMNTQFKVIKTITQDKKVGGKIEFVLEGNVDEKLFEKATQRKLAKVLATQIFEDKSFKENILDKIAYQPVAL